MVRFMLGLFLGAAVGYALASAIAMQQRNGDDGI
jgi:hypothetical protein